MVVLIEVLLPLALAVIMLALGVGLRVADFSEIAAHPVPFAVGLCCQVLAIPLVTLCVVLLTQPPPTLAAGMMLLSFCPGGVTSNLITRYAGGNVALSISLTGVISLASIVTLPLLMGITAAYFLGEAAQVDIAGLGVAMFLMTGLPVAAGMTLRARAPIWAARLEPLLLRAASGFFGVILVASIVTNWQVFIDNLPSLGPALITLNLALFALGFGVSALVGVSPRDQATITIETGIQNAALGITAATLIAGGGGGGIPELALPAGVYGILFYLVSLPVAVGLRRRIGKKSNDESSSAPPSRHRKEPT